MMVRYKQLLTYIKSAVTRNHSEKSINSILDYISTSKNVSHLTKNYKRTYQFKNKKIQDGIVTKFLRNYIRSVKRC